MVFRAFAAIFPVTPGKTATADAEIVPSCPSLRGGTTIDCVNFTSTPVFVLKTIPAGTEYAVRLLLSKRTNPLACSPRIGLIPEDATVRLATAMLLTERSGTIRVVRFGLLICGEAVKRYVSCTILL